MRLDVRQRREGALPDPAAARESGDEVTGWPLPVTLPERRQDSWNGATCAPDLAAEKHVYPPRAVSYANELMMQSWHY